MNLILNPATLISAYNVKKNIPVDPLLSHMRAAAQRYDYTVAPDNSCVKFAFPFSLLGQRLLGNDALTIALERALLAHLESSGYKRVAVGSTSTGISIYLYPVSNITPSEKETNG